MVVSIGCLHTREISRRPSPRCTVSCVPAERRRHALQLGIRSGSSWSGASRTAGAQKTGGGSAEIVRAMYDSNAARPRPTRTTFRAVACRELFDGFSSSWSRAKTSTPDPDAGGVMSSRSRASGCSATSPGCSAAISTFTPASSAFRSCCCATTARSHAPNVLEHIRGVHPRFSRHDIDLFNPARAEP